MAASNWAATAALVARTTPDAILIDIGSTSTDIIPLVAGRVAARGRTDPARLATGELVYTGAVRTPVEALVRDVPLGDGRAAVSAEWFATVGDAHVWLGQLDPADYTAPTPDAAPGDPRIRRRAAGPRGLRRSGDAGRRGDRRHRAGRASRPRSRWSPRPCGGCGAAAPATTAVVTGLGDFIAAEAARRAGLEVTLLSASSRPGGADRPGGRGGLPAATRLASGTT